METALSLFLIVVAAVLGGTLSKYLKLPAIVGYIISGIIFGLILPQGVKDISSLAQIGTILLLFSIGVELSFDRLSKFLKVAVFGSVIQIILVTLIGFFLLRLFGISNVSTLILAAGFSLSSTAVTVKILGDRGELGTIHGGVMLGWLLSQDLAVIPMMIILPILAATGGNWPLFLSLGLLKALAVIVATILIGKNVIPFLLHKVASLNSRELLLFASIALALGTAVLTSLVGISPALGAFLAGVVISESQEHHAVFAETRPLRDLFMALFFVCLGFIVSPAVIIQKIFLIITLTAIVLVLKIFIVFIVNQIFGFRGRAAITTSFGLAQVGEFAFVIFSTAMALKLLSPENTSIGIAVTLLSLIAAPILIKFAIPSWRYLKRISARSSFLSYLFSTGEKKNASDSPLTDHIIICGYGRVGSWIGKALTTFGVPFVVVDYDQKIVQELKDSGVPVLYGDPTEPEVIDAVGIKGAKAVILAIPDRIAQETMITYIQTVAPNVKIISRVHLDEDVEKLKSLRVNKIVQPEFEAAIQIVRTVLIERGKSKEDVMGAIRSLRVSHGR